MNSGQYHFTNAKVGQPQSWYSFTSGNKGFLYSASFTAKGQLRVELYINIGDERNKMIFDYFEKMKVQLEQSMKQPLSWERLDNRRASRISAVRQNTSIDDAATHGPEMEKWVIDQLLLVKKVFGPHLKSALQAASIAHPTATPTSEFSESVPLFNGEPG